MMKKSVIVLLISTIFLASCTAATSESELLPSNSIVPEGSVQTPIDVYEEKENPYNHQIAVTSQYIFVQDFGVIYRIERSTCSIERLLDNDSLGYNLQNAPSLVATNENIYFLIPKNIEQIRAGQEEILETGLFRADVNGGRIAEVATMTPGVHLLFEFDEYIVAYYEFIAEELPRDETFKIFASDNEAETLVQLSVDTFDEEWFAELLLFINANMYHDAQTVSTRLGYGADIILEGAAICANDAYYYYMHQDDTLYRLPHDSDTPQEVELSAAVQQSFRSNGGIQFVNYDNDWLYLSTETGVNRVRKDGSEYQVCIESGVASGFAIAVTDGNIIYYGNNSELYFYNATIGEVQKFSDASNAA